MPSFGKTSQDRLSTCDPRLQAIMLEAIQVVDFTVVVGHRGEEEQNKAFDEGKSQKRWPDGNHNASPSRAIDVAPVWYENGKAQVDWADVPAFARLMGVIQGIAFRHGIRLRFGIDWDGDFRSVGHDPGENFLDAPHVELVDP
jgi:peptidoglycan L-alanyl-D-glutamate endopeptidase CwlK